ncbi:hypothetical protein DFH09DRAFT_112594 [Mycena vulgaris]|nr:hypothetical protein DFH09DRAFT_112594 [Mycena vulgaris]
MPAARRGDQTFCKYGAGLPDIFGTNETEELRQRFVRLKRHIERALLAEARSDERLDRRDRSDAQCDLDLVQDWAKEIRDELLQPGQRTEHWTHDSLPWVLGYLTAWDEIEFSILSDSGIILVMRDIVHAPTIPVVSYMQPIRAWATSLLNRWALRPEAEALHPTEKARLGLDSTSKMPAQLPEESCIVPKILYRTGEIAQHFQELRDALTEGGADHSRIFSALDKIETWEAEPLSSQGIRDSLMQMQTSVTLRHPAEEVSERVYRAVRKFTIPTHIERRVTGFTYYTPADRGLAFPLTFRDKNALPGAQQSTISYGREPPDDRTWEDVTVETHAADPINVLFGEFVSTANSRHRHPLAPLTNFSIASTPEPFCSYVGKTIEEITDMRNRLWEVSPGRFVQGRVEDLQVAASNIVYYSRSNFSRVSVRELALKQPQERTLPPSCVAPAHWIRPAVPPGGAAVWECLPSLAFVGTGHDLYPGATAPPAIASHVYVPRVFDRERLGIYPHAAYRAEVTNDMAPVKLEPPLTAAQAHALLGRAIQYEVPAVPLPPLPPNARPKKKRREPPPPIYWGVVWGVDASDPACVELRIFTGGEYQEAPATLTVSAPCIVPSSPVDTTRPFTPKWVGALSLVEEEPQAPAIEVPDRLPRILELAAKSPQFEVGIGGDCVVLAGEIAVHGINSDFIEKVENCKPGIWQGGRRDTAEDGFLIWVRWLREGSIELTQPVENFAVALEGDSAALEWTRASTLSVDGGSVTLLARGLTDPEAVFALTGRDDVNGFVECVALHGAEEDSFHIPGGVSSYTGGDGGFALYTATDSDGKVVGIQISG